MSRVTFSDLYFDYIDDETSFEDCEKVEPIEIVPRKIVEMIIEECERNEVTNYKYGNYCAGNNLKNIREYAESLLKQFEKEGE